MTETEWNASSKPTPLLEFLRQTGKGSDRKLRLFVVACCRQVWHLMTDERSRQAVEAAERYADRLASSSELAIARSGQERIALLDEGRVGLLWEAGWYTDAYVAARLHAGDPDAPAVLALAAAQNDARVAVELCLPWAVALGLGPPHQAALLRDVLGPLSFRPVAIEPAWLAWNDGIVRHLAEAIYKKRVMPTGTLDNAGLLILADALEEAGCDNEEVLFHLRQQGVSHYRGCWVIDLLLNKE